ncbi:Bromodomain, related [Eimeria mitis]|uniref:Bromodomain, related n=1 Tax=Eimeria mitis TaxID=44415 RepID=U6K0C2_9EIME|nr:Bromodomain, related [Eimeria mitis]CDJ29213.1 Bromodomain, related [Eimeria mitis]
MKRVKENIKARFCPPVIEKEVAQLLKQLSPIAPHRLPLLPESSLISFCPPVIEKEVAQLLKQLSPIAPHHPSCGRGEGIALLKRGSRSRSSASNPLVVQQPLRRHAAGGIAGTVDDLRKLGMMELRARLLQYGLSDAVIRTLPRWDQVALVRQYRDGFGAEDGSSKGRGAGVRLPTEEYEAKLCSILKRQQAALRADEPVVTDTDDDMPPSTPHQSQQHQLGADAAAAAGAAAASATGQHQQGGTGEDVADALFAGCEDSDHEQADETELEMRELQVLRDRQEARSQRPLTQEEQLRAEATVRAVPCLRWTRKRRQQVGDSFAADRCILIYGAENIRTFLAWRDKRLAKKRQRQMSAVHSKEALAGKRICRACGRPGHIASNVNCPLYRGPKRLGSAVGETAVKRKRRRTGGSDVELGLTAETNLHGEGAGSLCSSSTRRRRGGRGGAAALLSGSSEDERDDGYAAAAEATADVWGADEPQPDDSDEVSSELDDDDDDDEGIGKSGKSSFSRSSKTARGIGKSGKSSFSRSSKTARQRKRGRGSGGAADRDAAHVQQPIDALNVSFARVVNLLLQQQTFKPFVNRVDDRVAPGYSVVVQHPMFLRKVLSKCRERQYTSVAAFKEDIDLIVCHPFVNRVDDRVAPGYSVVVQHPMFLRKVLSKCRERQYTSVAAFKEDIDLIVSNCLLFNPVGSPSAWLRDRAIQLQQLALQRLAEQPQIAEYEAALQQSAIHMQQQQQYRSYGYDDD